MARRQGAATLQPTSRSSKSHIRASDDRRTQTDSPFRSIHLWFLLLIATYLLFEHAKVFAAPTPHFFSKPPLEPSNTTINPSTHSQSSNPHRQSDTDTDAARHPVTSSTNPSQSVPAGPPANVAYFIQVAESTLDHLPRLLRAIHHDSNVYAIHFDLKIPQNRVKPIVDKINNTPRFNDNVFIMKSQLITYRGISMLLNTISAIRLLLNTNSSWHYFINISGADYPLLAPHTIRKLLGHKLGLNFFTFAPKRTWDGMAENRLSEVWYDEALTFRAKPSSDELVKLPGRNPLVDDRNFDVSHAEAWMIISREFCDFVVNNDKSLKMLVAFGYAVDSSEHYFASLAWSNQQFRSTLVPHSLRMIIWLHEGVLSGQHPYSIDEMDSDGEYIFKDEISDSVLFFARKFGTAESKLMDYIDERSKNKEVIAAAAEHIAKKISSRETRLAEL